MYSENFFKIVRINFYQLIGCIANADMTFISCLGEIYYL